jgi:hypothetical protein
MKSLIKSIIEKTEFTSYDSKMSILYISSYNFNVFSTHVKVVIEILLFVVCQPLYAPVRLECSSGFPS